ncbi:FAD-binding oxidoreductase [Arthrobacter crystallopoietes]|uniref:FAD-binding oxidoreductase n=1 Tax=Crystallibacter crystallopoietes TaxID=37928 RepID=UPI001ABEAB48|nr:FAD-binding oxidoreductase [Arthrobacter crystallopoietes]QTG82137.1 FAD-binding oxidoreductase [Arthrobacter crystallopoietes]
MPIQTPSPLNPAAVNKLNSALHGQLFRSGENGYDVARKVFNAMVDRRPALIVRPADADDIRLAVSFARENDLPVSVKGGGHNVAGSAVLDGGVMLDCSGMRSIRVDADKRTAQAAAGALLAELDRATQVYGLATPLGVVSVTGIAGLTLGGGIGWINGCYGLACDNVLSADIVTSDGGFLTASPDNHADLHWAIRGGGGNFGVVTSFTYSLHPVGQVMAGGLSFPAERTKEVLQFYPEFAASCPDELSMSASLGRDDLGRPVFGVGLCWCGEPDEVNSALRPLRSLGPNTDAVMPMDYCTLQSSHDAGFPPERYHYWKSSFFTGLTDEAVDVLLHFAAEMPSPASGIGMQQLHGAAARVDPSATAFPHRKSQSELLILSQWADPAETESNVAWTRALFNAMEPFASHGVYVNDLGEEGDDRVRAAYGANYDRLAAVKAIYDPANTFQSNQNIRPTA